MHRGTREYSREIHQIEFTWEENKIRLVKADALLLQIRSRKSVALINIARLVAFFEPVHSLL